jgi:acyl CoA:acetate/3-ketoacid CoA transferase
VLEPAIRADVAIVKAWKGDRAGNLVFRKTARNFNPMIATCGRTTVAEVEELVEPGELDPDQIHTPGIYVDRIIQGRPTRSASSSAHVRVPPPRASTTRYATPWPGAPPRNCATATT